MPSTDLAVTIAFGIISQEDVRKILGHALTSCVRQSVSASSVMHFSTVYPTTCILFVEQEYGNFSWVPAPIATMVPIHNGCTFEKEIKQNTRVLFNSRAEFNIAYVLQLFQHFHSQ